VRGAYSRAFSGAVALRSIFLNEPG